MLTANVLYIEPQKKKKKKTKAKRKKVGTAAVGAITPLLSNVWANHPTAIPSPTSTAVTVQVRVGDRRSTCAGLISAWCTSGARRCGCGIVGHTAAAPS